MLPLQKLLSLIYALLFIAAVQTANAASPIFRDPTVYLVGPDPVTAQVADLNHDGKPDIVEVNHYCCGPENNTMGVLLGNGDGTFGAPTYYAVGKLPTWVAIADFNADGFPDLAVSNAGSKIGPASVVVRLGNGDGTFQRPVTYSAGSNCQFVAAADVNADGKVDLVVANKDSNDVSILLGNGDGTFQAAVSYAAGTAPTALVITDINNDGKLDLAVADNVSSATASVQVLLGNGNGSFQAAKPATGSANAIAIAAGDFNRDGNQDVVVNDSFGNTLSVLLGNGDGTFKTPSSLTVKYRPTGLSVGDLNKDGKLDIVATERGGDVISILLGNGDGTFQSHREFIGGGQSVALADLNGDGNLDAVSTRPMGPNDSYPAEIDVSLGNGDGKLQQDGYTAFSGQVSLGVVVADNNHDGIPDVIAPEYSANTLDVYLGKGDGSFQAPLKYAAGTGPRNPATGDFNDDGIQDVAVLNCPSFGGVTCSLAVLMGNADGSFQAPVVTPSVGSGNTFDIYAGDLNGDGKADIVVPDYTNNRMTVLLSNGDGTFQQVAKYAIDAKPFRAVMGDFNRDGNLDIAVTGGSSAGYLDIFLGRGDGTFQPPTTLSLPATGLGIAAGDLNGDGITDLVVGMFNLQAQVFLGNGDGTFTMANSFATPGDLQSLTLGDVNGDGKLDVVTSNLFYFGTLLGNGDGTLQPYTWYRLSGFSTEVGVADFNNDGAQDIVYNYAGFGVVLNNGGTASAATNAPTRLGSRQK